MLITRTTAVLVGGGLLTALIASPALMRTGSRSPTESSRPFAAEQQANATPSLVAPRLDALLAHNAAARAAASQRGRNPFTFASRPEPQAPAPKPAIVEPPAPIPPARPPIALAAIAEDAGDNGAIVRTAVLSIAGQVFLVKEGERLSSRFVVVRISADVVELRDETADVLVRLALR